MKISRGIDLVKMRHGIAEPEGFLNSGDRRQRLDLNPRRFAGDFTIAAQFLRPLEVVQLTTG